MAQRKIGVFGGTFDPIHIGHMSIAEEVRKKLGLEEIVFVPTGQPVFKEHLNISGAQHRLEMVILATAAIPYFNISTIELERPGPSYSIDTIKELKSRLYVKTELYLIVGLDALNELTSWKQPELLLQLSYIVCVKRAGYKDVNLKYLESKVPGAQKKVIMIDINPINVSASDIRQRVACGLNIEGMVPDEIEKYIRENGLYLEGEKQIGKGR